MRSYVQVLNKLDEQKTLIEKREKLVILLSGQSDFAHSELSEEQKNLLNHFKQYGYSVLETGFPYNQEHNFQGCERAGSIRASIRNIQQFAYSIFSIKYRQTLAKHLQPVFNSANIIIICQSSGLNMLKMALPYLKINNNADITIIALGPVVFCTFKDERFKVFTIKGYKDWVSVFFDKQPVNFWISCNHLDYCQNERVFELIDGIFKNED